MGDPQEATDNLATSEPPTPSAASANSVGRDDPSDQPSKRARRAFLTQNACTRCRQKKTKVFIHNCLINSTSTLINLRQCDGKRPICGRCEKHGAECTYDVAQEGMTRMQHLQQQLDIRNAEFTQLQNLFNAMRYASDQQATGLLARMRLGASVEELLGIAGDPGSSSIGFVDNAL
jgi:hypothetical protein